MANIARFRAGQTPEYLISVNTPEYSSDPDCIVNPDVSAVINVPRKYWKRVGHQVQEMSLAEKQAIDDAEASAVQARIDNLEQIDAVVLAKALVRLGVATRQQMVAAIRQVLNN